MTYTSSARNIVRKAASIQTNLPDNQAGLMNPEQSREFMRMAFEDTPLMKLCRHEMRTSPKGEIDKIGVGGRILQKKIEGKAGKSVGVKHSAVEYSCIDYTLPWDISERFLRENIERQGYAATVAKMMAKAVGVNLQDLGINGDTEYTGEEDKDFITICDGWGKKLKSSSHLIENPTWGLDMWYDTFRSLPDKYADEKKLVWFVSPSVKLAWRQFCESKAMAGGNTKLYNSDAPCGVQMVGVPRMRNQIWLSDPYNFINVGTYDMILRQTTEGVDAIQGDVRYFALHGNTSYVVEEADAAAIATGVNWSAT